MKIIREIFDEPRIVGNSSYRRDNRRIFIRDVCSIGATMSTIDLNELATFITQAQKLQDILHDIVPYIEVIK